jgi:mono/diheme cytochrome c family protein
MSAVLARLIFAILVGGAIVAISLIGGRVESDPTTHDIDDPKLGRRVYANCQACHGIDGRGVPGYAPGLAGMPTVVGDEQALLAKIMSGGSGLQGFTAVMPGFSRLSDAEIAAVATYVRASWGNAASAVTSDKVAAVRRLTQHPRRSP